MAQRPNPQTIGVCALIALYSDPSSPLHDLGVPETSVGLFLEDCVFGNVHRGVSPATVGAPPGAALCVPDDASLARWMAQVQRRLGDAVTELMVDTLTMASESVDALVDLFESLHGAIHEGLVDMTSVHGVYLRQHCLGFDELSFELTCLLWQALKERLRCLRGDLEREGPDLENVGHRCDPTNDAATSSWAWPHSAAQLQDVLRQECVDFEADTTTAALSAVGTAPSPTTTNDRRTRRSFEQTELYVRAMLQKDPELPAAYFLRYLNCLRHGERAGALDALHQYFDHAMVQHTGTGRGGGPTGAPPASNDVLQFSAILLAMTHSSFGDSSLALLATEEAVRVAQQSKDAACVAFALGWLFEHHGHGTAERQLLLQRCASRAAIGHLRPLLAGAHLTLTKHALAGGDGGARATPSTAGPAFGGTDPADTGGATGGTWTAATWNHLLQVTAEPSTDHRVLDRPTYLSQNPRETMRSMAVQRLMSVGVWDSVGMPVMSELASKVTLNRPQDLSHDHVVTAIQNVSRLALYGTPRSAAIDTRCLDDGAVTTDARGGRSKVTDSEPATKLCMYGRAVRTVLQLRQELGLEGDDLDEPILHNLALLFHEWAVNRGDLDDATALQRILDSYLHRGLADHDQLYVDIKMQKCLFLYRTRNWEKAKETAKRLVETCKAKKMFKDLARSLIQLAIIDLESDRKRGTSALSPLMEALAMCEKWEMHGLHAAGMSVLAVVFMRLQNPKRAIAILEATLPTLLQREHVSFQASAYLTLSKAHMKIASSMSAGPSKSSDLSNGKAPASSSLSTTPSVLRAIKKRQQKTLQALNKCVELFEECQDCYGLRETLYLQAQVHSLLGNLHEREASSERFLKLCQHPGTRTDLSSSILDSIDDPAMLEGLIQRSI